MSKYKFHIDVLSFEDLMKYFITIQISPCLIQCKLLLEEGVIFEVSEQVILHKRKLLISMSKSIKNSPNTMPLFIFRLISKKIVGRKSFT